MDELINLASMDRNPIQDTQFRKLLEQSGIPFTVDNGRTNVTGFGFGGNTARPMAESFFSPTSMAVRQGAGIQANIESNQRDFLNRFSTEVPAAIAAAEQELGLPQLRSTAQREMEFLEDIPQLQEQRTTGKGVSAGQLRRIIGAETQEQAPIAQRAVEQAQTATGLLQDRMGTILQPFQIEAGFLGENAARAFDAFKMDVQSQLQKELQNMSIAADRASQERAFQNALKLAEAEQSMSGNGVGQFVNLGNRIALVNPLTGEEISSFGIGLTPSRASSGGGAGGDTLGLF